MRLEPPTIGGYKRKCTREPGARRSALWQRDRTSKDRRAVWRLYCSRLQHIACLEDHLNSLPTGLVDSVNVGSIRAIQWEGGAVRTAIWKSPVVGRVAVRGVNVVGDDQGDRQAHGGPDKAVYAYHRADLDWWSRELQQELLPGAFGENLTVQGFSLTDAVIGERWRVGTVLFEVAQPRIPCFKLGIRMGDRRFPPRFAAAGRPGAYLRIIEEGELAAGDPVEIIHRPDHDVTVGLINRAYHVDHSLASQLLAAPQLPRGWREWATRYVSAPSGKR